MPKMCRIADKYVNPMLVRVLRTNDPTKFTVIEFDSNHTMSCRP